MSNARRRRSLALIEKLARDRAQSAARERATLEAERDRLIDERTKVLGSLVDRPAISDSAAALYLAGWIRSVSEHADQLAQEAERLRTTIADAAQRTAEQYRDAESFRLLVDRLDMEAAARQQAAEAEALSPYLTKTPGKA